MHADTPITIAGEIAVERLIGGGLLVDGELVPKTARHAASPYGMGPIEHGRGGHIMSVGGRPPRRR